MATIKKRSALNRVFKTKTATPTAAATSTLADNGSASKKSRKTQQMKWETHRERINGYFFRIDEEGGELVDGQEGYYYVFVGIFKNAVVVHIRIYAESNWGDLIPTKEGCCLNKNEYKTLSELAPTAQNRWTQEGSSTEMLRHALAPTGNWFFLIGENEEGKLRFGIKLLLATNKSGELETINKGAVLTPAQFETFCSHIPKINEAVKDMSEYIVHE